MRDWVKEAKEEILELCELPAFCGVRGTLADQIILQVKLCYFPTNELAITVGNYSSDYVTLLLNRWLWPYLSDDQRTVTLIHELTHAVLIARGVKHEHDEVFRELFRQLLPEKLHVYCDLGSIVFALSLSHNTEDQRQFELRAGSLRPKLEALRMHERCNHSAWKIRHLGAPIENARDFYNRVA